MRRGYGREILIIVVVAALIFGGIMGIVQTRKISHYYGMTAVVYNISEATDTVTIKDFNGNLWQFKGVEDWALDDVVSCIMDDKGTTLIKDDEIVKVRYSGYFEGWN